MGVLAVVFVVAGVLPWCGPAPTLVRLLAIVAIVVGLLVAGLAWGLLHSVALDARRAQEAALDAVLHAAAGGCDCGNHGDAPGAAGHDPGRLDAAQPGRATEATDATCATCAPSQSDCPHTCANCALESLRPS